MAVIMKGDKASEAMKEKILADVDKLKGRGIIPALGILRVGARPDDLAYERGAVKKMNALGIQAKVFAFEEDVSQEKFVEGFLRVNEDPEIHGILLFRPLPKHLSEEEIKNKIYPHKDVDCMSHINMARVFYGERDAFPPCTPQAVMELLKAYEIPLAGKNVVIVGRSLVVGKPLAMLMLNENATVTICHRKTRGLEKVCREADVLVAAAGSARMIGKDHVGAHSIVVDVGINMDGNNKLCGDCDFDAVSAVAAMASPVPGGVGSVTTSVLARHVVDAAQKLF